MPRKSSDRLIAAARAGDADALGDLLEQHRIRFRIIARQKMDSLVQGRVDPSDVIQQTFLAAKRDFHTFNGTAEEQFVAWLNRILEHNISNTLNFHLRAYKRSVLREHDGERAGAIASVPDHQISPSQSVVQAELRANVLLLIDTLPSAEQQAVRLRYLEEASLDEIATTLDRSRQGVAGLLKRGLRRLREQMKTNHGETDK